MMLLPNGRLESLVSPPSMIFSKEKFLINVTAILKVSSQKCWSSCRFYAGGNYLILKYEWQTLVVISFRSKVLLGIRWYLWRGLLVKVRSQKTHVIFKRVLDMPIANADSLFHIVASIALSFGRWFCKALFSYYHYARFESLSTTPVILAIL